MSALKWHTRAAIQGHTAAQRYAADLYASGKSVKKDNAPARQRYERAAANGDEESIAAMKKLSS